MLTRGATLFTLIKKYPPIVTTRNYVSNIVNRRVYSTYTYTSFDIVSKGGNVTLVQNHYHEPNHCQNRSSLE